MTRTPPVDQSALWNGPGGQVWVAQQAILDGLFQPMADLLVAELPGAVTQLLDGCGTGASLLAQPPRPATHCTGLDISAPMLALARQRAELGLDVDFIVADAQRHPLPSRTSTGSSRGWA
jgi:SAM-dependent methyltransferase